MNKSPRLALAFALAVLPFLFGAGVALAAGPAEHGAHASGHDAPSAAHGAEAEHGGGHALLPDQRPADEDHHWWIGRLLPISLRESVASVIGPSVRGEKPSNLNVGHLFMGALVFCIGIFLAVRARKNVVASGGAPPSKWSAFAFFDVLMEAILGLMTNMMPRERALRFLPLVMSAAVFILISNFLGLIPGFVPPTQSLNTTLALGLIAFVYYNYQGIRQVGLVKYLKHFLGPLLPLAPLILVIELISHCVRPLSLGLRLMGNMFGDHQVLFIFMSFGIPLIPLPIMALGTLVCIVQTVVFTLLFIVYLSLATEDHDHGHEAHDEHGDGHHAGGAKAAHAH